MNDDDPIIDFVGQLLIAAVVGAAALAIGYEAAETTLRKEAIRAGAAYWTVDPATGDTTFNWRTNR